MDLNNNNTSEEVFDECGNISYSHIHLISDNSSDNITNNYSNKNNTLKNKIIDNKLFGGLRSNNYTLIKKKAQRENK